MYAPGFVTGGLFRRFGVLNVILAGVAVMAGGAAVALSGTTVTHFVVALTLVGAGWNFMYTGGTLLLTEAYAPEEKARTQGANDFIVFSIMGVSSLSSGALVSAAGWEAMNWGVLPFLALIAVVVATFARHRRRPAARPNLPSPARTSSRPHRRSCRPWRAALSRPRRLRRIRAHRAAP